MLFKQKFCFLLSHYPFIGCEKKGIILETKLRVLKIEKGTYDCSRFSLPIFYSPFHTEPK